MLSNAYFLAKIRFDTAENEPAKNLQNFANFPNFAIPNLSFASLARTQQYPLRLFSGRPARDAAGPPREATSTRAAAQFAAPRQLLK